MLPDPTICVVSDRTLFPGRDDTERLARQNEVLLAAVEGGANAIQLREKDLSAGLLYANAQALRAALGRRAQLWVNDRVDVAVAANADAVILGETSLPPNAAREM